MTTRVLAIGAHPDDIEFGAGATLLKHQASGHEIHVLVLTSGETGCGDYATNVREHEALAAAELLGAAITFGRLPDAHLPDGKPTIDVIERVTAAFSPDIAYIHSIHDTHQDHRAAARASQASLRTVQKLYAYQAPSATPEFTAQRYPDITDFLPGKMDLIKAHQSQFEMRRYMETEYVEATARYHGLRAGCRHAEAMEIIADRDPRPDVF
jgi:LmbE family N-acetylglucosaminyl deacetylase